MKILHLNTEDMGGGAPIAVRRLHTALNSLNGISSTVGVKVKTTDALAVQTLPGFRSKIIEKVVDKCCNEFVKLYKPTEHVPYSAYFLNNAVPAAINALKPDIVHLHWICGNFISPKGLQAISEFGIPVVWTFHDTWPFTGGCHITNGCTRWMEHCGNCPALVSRGKRDISWLLWRAKKKAYLALKPAVIALNKKYHADVQRSPLLAGCHSRILPNTIDTSVFRPISKKIARSLLGLDIEGRSILFGACDSASNRNKGFDLLSTALGLLSKKDARGLSCLVFGASHPDKSADLPLPTTYLGMLRDELTLALAYSAADVFVCPSREDNLPNTVMESMACGTPVAGFAVGGIPDMVEHKINGMLATPHDPNELVKSIAYILADEDRRQHMGAAARQSALQKYSMAVVAPQYLALYKQLAKGQLG